MTDHITPEHRSLNMSLIRSKDTKPEIFVRSILHRLGFRFRKNVNDLPGKPDIVLPKYKTIIFIHGCFWHQHLGCKRSNMPKSKIEYWEPKLNKNVQRDTQHKNNLEDAGWNVITVWECETKNAEELSKSLKKILMKTASKIKK